MSNAVFYTSFVVSAAILVFLLSLKIAVDTFRVGMPTQAVLFTILSALLGVGLLVEAGVL